jgi:hypothetical protein
MDARDLLSQVSEVYRNLRSLAAEATLISESGDEYSSQRNERRVQFFYVAPDRMRFESLGDNGRLQVCDGTQVHTVFHFIGPVQRQRYNRLPATPARLPHSFLSQAPLGGGNEPFLFTHINERIREAGMMPDEDGRRVVSVTYEPGPHPGITTSAVRFRIHPDSLMVVGVEADVGHRFPMRDEIRWTRQTLAIRELRADAPIPDSTFDFTPPPDAVEMPGWRGGGGGGGGGFIRGAANGREGFAHQGSHEWQGETLVEHSRWSVRGVVLTFARHMTFSAGNKSVEIVEKATGPKGQAETTSTLDLS